MAHPIRKQQVASLIQQALGTIFIQESPRLFGRVMITVTAVHMTNNLGLAKVYVSFMQTADKNTLLKSITARKKELRGFLGKRLGSKLRRIPDIQFYIDNSTEQAIRMEHLMNTLSIPSHKADKPA